MKEIWIDIKGYENLYQISNYGNVKSLERTIKRDNKGNLFVKEKILKPGISGDGYYCVTLSKNGKTKFYKIHRLMALNFFENNGDNLVINHIDGNRLNNKLSNLELCTQSHNIREAMKLGTFLPPSLNKFGKEHHRSKPVVQYDLSNNFIKEWENTMQVKRELGLNPSNITQCCKGHYKTAYGYIWKYREVEER